MKLDLLGAVKAHALGEIARHKANVLVYLVNPAGIGEHSDITSAVEAELDMIAKYEDRLTVIQKRFTESQPPQPPQEPTNDIED